MSVMQWNSTYSVGIEEIDFQHKKLIDLINTLSDAMQIGKSKEVLGTILAELLEYGINHFAVEEEMFKASNYVNAKEHIQEHQKFLETAQELLDGFNSNKISISIATLHFVKDWIINHILVSDMNYSEPMKKAGYH